MTGAGRSVLILGGGVAGLASAVAHRARGWKVRLVEARDRLGGRAWSFPAGHPRAGLDNGPHVALGCYGAFQRLLTALGSEEHFHRPNALRLAWLTRGGAFESLDPPRLPAPLHLPAAVLRLGSLEVAERFDLLLSCLAPWIGRPIRGESVDAWLRRGGHRGLAAELLFDPLCRAVMNEEPSDADAELFAATLREAFAQGAAGSAIWIPTRPWSEILDGPARRFLGANHERGRVVALCPTSGPGHAPSVLLADGRRLERHDRLVLALPFETVAVLDAWGLLGQGPARIEPSPILSLHLALEAGTLDFGAPLVAFRDGAPFHFLCRRPDAQGRARDDCGATLIAGAARELDGLKASEIVEIGLGQLASFLGRRQAWPAAVRAEALVLREPSATIAAVPATRVLRPAPGPSAVPGLWLAGDWTDTGLPSTLEGAARSGFDPVDAEGRGTD